MCKFISLTQSLSHPFNAAENDECLAVYRLPFTVEEEENSIKQGIIEKHTHTNSDEHAMRLKMSGKLA